MSITINVDVDVDVDVDLSEFDDDDLRDEFERRGLEANLTGTHWDTLQEIFYAFKLGQNDHAMAITKTLVQDITGRIL